MDPKRVITTGSGRISATITLAPATLKTHPQVTWSALHVFHGSPSSRAILGTPAGEQLLDEWRTAATT